MPSHVVPDMHSGAPVTPFAIRPAAPVDVPDILRLVRALADYERLLHEVTADEADFHAALFGPAPPLHALLAEVPNKPPVGLALWFHSFSTFTGRRKLFLEDLFIEPAHRGAGIGLALLRHLAAHAVREKCWSMEWRVLNWNQPSITFYEKLGSVVLADWHTRQLHGAALVALAQGTDDA